MPIPNNIPICCPVWNTNFKNALNNDHVAGDFGIILEPGLHGNIVGLTVPYCTGFMSWAAATAAIPTASEFGVAYDLEHWDNTPANERADPLGTCASASALCHSKSLEFMLVTDRQFNVQFTVNGVNQFAQYADRTIVQGQHQQAQGPQTFKQWIEGQYHAYKAGNPNVKFGAQVLVSATQSVDSAIAALNALTIVPDFIALFAVNTDFGYFQTALAAIRAGTIAPTPLPSGNGPVVYS